MVPFHGVHHKCLLRFVLNIFISKQLFRKKKKVVFLEQIAEYNWVPYAQNKIGITFFL